jgi:hypothetical protein
VRAIVPIQEGWTAKDAEGAEIRAISAPLALFAVVNSGKSLGCRDAKEA